MFVPVSIRISHRYFPFHLWAWPHPLFWVRTGGGARPGQPLPPPPPLCLLVQRGRRDDSSSEEREEKGKGGAFPRKVFADAAPASFPITPPHFSPFLGTLSPLATKVPREVCRCMTTFSHEGFQGDRHVGRFFFFV